MLNNLNNLKSFSLDIPVLKETISKLENSIKNIEKIGTDVENIGDRLVSESWEGNATNSFKEHQQDWKKGYDEMLNQLIDFKESLEKVVLARAEEINELALELPTALGGSKGTGYRNIISMEQEGIEELKTKCKTLVYEDYEYQREIMGTIEGLSNRLNYSFSIVAEATKNKRLIEENQDKLQSYREKLQNYEDTVLQFEKEVVDEMSKYAVVCGHKLSQAEFREVLKYQKDDAWKALLSKNMEELSDIEKLVLKAEYEDGITDKIKTFLMKQLGIEELTYDKLKAMSSENLMNKLRDSFIGAVEILKKCKIVDSHLTWKSAVNLTFSILPIPSEETISEVTSSMYSKMKHFIEKDRRYDARLGIVSAMNEDLLSSFATDKAAVFSALGVDSEAVNQMYRNDYIGIDDWIEPLKSKATHFYSFYLGRMLGDAAAIAIAMGIGVESAGVALKVHEIDAGALAFSNFGDNYNNYVKYSSEGTGKDTTYFQELLDAADKSLDAWLIAHGYAGTDEYGARALCMFEDDNGVYHAKTNAWQQIGGYNDLYDKAFDYGTSMDAQFFDFTYNEREFRVWAWKGDYINLGAGAEIGIYSHTSGILGLVNIESPNEDHWLVDTNLSMPMTLNLVDNEDNEISDYRPTEEQWWITSFNPAYKDVEASNLTATYTINFSSNEYDKGMYDAFREQWEGQYENLTFNNYMVTFGFLRR